MDENKEKNVEEQTAEGQVPVNGIPEPEKDDGKKNETPHEDVVVPEKGWLHKKADSLAERCGKRELAKATKKKEKQAKKAQKQASGGLTTGQKVVIGVGLVVAALGGGMLARSQTCGGTQQSNYELSEGDVKVEPQAIGEGSPEPVNTEVSTNSEAHPEE